MAKKIKTKILDFKGRPNMTFLDLERWLNRHLYGILFWSILMWSLWAMKYLVPNG